MVIEKAALDDFISVCDMDTMLIGNLSRQDYLTNSIDKETCVIARMNNGIVGFAVYET